jgi:hypothetical protein
MDFSSGACDTGDFDALAAEVVALSGLVVGLKVL